MDNIIDLKDKINCNVNDLLSTGNIFDEGLLVVVGLDICSIFKAKLYNLNANCAPWLFSEIKV